MFSSLKQAFGAWYDGGRGVAGTGSNSRGLHTSGTLNLSVYETRGEPSETSGQPKEETHRDRNEHANHKERGGENSWGKENAGDAAAQPVQLMVAPGVVMKTVLWLVQ